MPAILSDISPPIGLELTKHRCPYLHGSFEGGQTQLRLGSSATGRSQPSWFGFLLSFCIIFITWVNHNRILNLIDKSSPQFIYANGFKLLTIIILPFTTKVMAEYLQTDNSQPAISLYCFGVLLNNVGWNVLIWSALHPHLLAKNGVSKKQVQPGIRSAQYGFFITLFIFIFSFWFPIIAIVLVSITWIAWIILGIALTRRKQEE